MITKNDFSHKYIIITSSVSINFLGVLYLKSRFGFIKLALEYGIPLIPVFSFGIDKIYNFWCPKGKLINNIARKIGFLPVLIFGLFNLPFGNNFFDRTVDMLVNLYI